MSTLPQYTCPYMYTRHHNCFLTGSQRYAWNYGNGRTRNAMQRSVYIQVCQLSFKVEWPRYKWHYPNGLNIFDNQWIAITRYYEHASVCLGPEDQVVVFYFHMIWTYFRHLFWVCMWRHILKQAHIAFPRYFSSSAPWHLSWGVALRSEHWHRALLIVHVVLPSDVYWCVGRATCLQHVCNWYRLSLVLYVLLPEELEWFVAVRSFQEELRRPKRSARRLSDRLWSLTAE